MVVQENQNVAPGAIRELEEFLDPNVLQDEEFKADHRYMNQVQ